MPQTMQQTTASRASRSEQLHGTLRALHSGSPDIEASAIISADGLIIASSLPRDIEEIRVGGVCAALLNLGTRVASEISLGEMQQVLIRGENGYVVMVSAAEGTMLLCSTTSSAKLGLLFLDMNRAVEEICNIL